MQITLYTDPNAFDVLEKEWHDLMRRAISAPLFMTVEYQKIWWEHLGTGQLRLLAIRDTTSRQLVGLAPLFVDNQTLYFVGGVDVSDYLDFLVDRDYYTQVYKAIEDYLAIDLASEWQTAYFCCLACRSLTPEIMVEFARPRGWMAYAEVEEVCPVISLPDSWDTYLAGITKKQRHEIRRKLRKAENSAQSRWYVIETANDLTDKAIDTFIDLHQKSTPDKKEFWNQAMLNFFRSLIKRIAESGWLKLYFLEIGGQLASTLLCFDYQNELLLYNSGFDMQRFAHLSPGNVLISYSIQHAIKLGRIRYDFLRGNEVYKFRFGAVVEDVFGVKIVKER